MNPKIIFEDENLIVLDKPAGINADDIPRRVHRLDKDTSGVLLVAKNDKILEFLQKQFQARNVEKKYIALATGNIKNAQGIIKSLIGRSPKDRRKQKVYLPNEPKAEGKREAITKYAVLRRFSAKGGFASGGKDYTLIEARPQTGRKHQIRAHFAYLGHPIAGDKLYGFKNQPCPKELKRQFLHASSIKIKMPNNEIKKFESQLPKDLQIILDRLN